MKSGSQKRSAQCQFRGRVQGSASSMFEGQKFSGAVNGAATTSPFASLKTTSRKRCTRSSAQAGGGDTIPAMAIQLDGEELAVFRMSDIVAMLTDETPIATAKSQGRVRRDDTPEILRGT